MVRVGQVCSMGRVARGVMLVAGLARLLDPMTGGVRLVKLVILECWTVVSG